MTTPEPAPRSQDGTPGARFALGDHLRVRRRGYFHHGIYVGDGRVVQFGGRVLDKPHARIEEVPLADFELRGRVEVVDHSKLTWIDLWKLPDAFPPERIVARARCLVETQPSGAYNLFGRNCETVALWCTCGMAESLQRQEFQRINAALGSVELLATAWLSRTKRLGRRTQRIVLCVTLARFGLLGAYYLHNYRFYRDVKGTCDQL